MGTEALARARGAAARGRRRGKLGKVLVLPGIMGTELDSVDRKGDSDRIWINFVRLIAGRIGDLELGADGQSAHTGVHVRPAGVHRKTYVPLLMELDTRWHVRPFPFDWREDIDKSAARLDGEIKAFGAGEPVHLVAHSMGGLVSRRFIQLFPETWKTMDDASGGGRGGRLVMLGTPNRGSFAIPLTLSGAEKLVKLLAKADVHHSQKQLLEIVGTFPGLYQMLPFGARRPRRRPQEALRRLELGRAPGPQGAPGQGRQASSQPRPGHRREASPLCRRSEPGDSFPDPDRIAGAVLVSREPRRRRPRTARARPARGRDDVLGRRRGARRPGQALERSRRDHGALADRQDRRPADRRSRRSRATPCSPWLGAGDEVAPLDPEVDAILARPKLERRAGAPPELTPEEQIRLENLTLAEYLGTGGEPAEAVRGELEDARALRRKPHRREGARRHPAEARRRGRVGRRDESRRRRLHGRALRGCSAPAGGARPRQGGLGSPRQEEVRPTEPRHHPALPARKPSGRGR